MRHFAVIIDDVFFSQNDFQRLGGDSEDFAIDAQGIVNTNVTLSVLSELNEKGEECRF